jgi:hypothetical protein
MNTDKLVFNDSRIDFFAANETLLKMGATDGLPVIPATKERVRDWMRSSDFEDPSQPLAVMEPSIQTVTHYDLVVNAIMAGATASCLPVIKSAVQAICEEPFNLLGIQTTTGAATPAILVNGSIREEIGLNSKGNCLGPGFRANAAIGRALRLILLNVGGATPGTLDMATIGQPGKFTFCFAENEEESPWPPFHETRGYSHNESVVTAFGASGTFEALDAFASCAEDILLTLAHSALLAGNIGPEGGIGGGEVVFLIPPEVANLMERDGFDREKAQQFIFEKAQAPLNFFSSSGQKRIASFRDAAGLDMEALVCISKNPESIFLIVCGGVGIKCCLIPTWSGGTTAISKALY